jgi:pSer/pThr/pTyr-binding forkhead associated (FHA) protein
MNARIRVVGGPLSGETINVRGGKLLIGREEDCHLRPNSEFVSRHHCALLLDDYTLRIRDLGSKNGTFVNGRRIGSTETILLHDDVVAIGETTFLIDLNQATPPVPPAAPESQVPLPSPALEGTGIFEGDTVQADVPPVVPPLTQNGSATRPVA